jgi:hypothetical protein
MAKETIPCCLECGNKIEIRLFIKSGGKRKFCSKKCTIKAKIKNAAIKSAKKCLLCGSQFRAKSIAKSVFCSKKCHVIYNKAKPRECLQCKVVFSPVRWVKHKNRYISDRSNNRQFCSRECMTILAKTGYEKKCMYCGVMFTPVRFLSRERYFLPYNIPTTCSKSCRDKAYPFSDERRKLVSQRMHKNNHPNWQGGSHRCGYRGENWQEIAEYIRNKNKRRCARCGKTEKENGRRLDVNHIVPFHQFS